jgi:hypothetical protein
MSLLSSTTSVLIFGPGMITHTYVAVHACPTALRTPSANAGPMGRSLALPVRIGGAASCLSYRTALETAGGIRCYCRAGRLTY